MESPSSGVVVLDGCSASVRDAHISAQGARDGGARYWRWSGVERGVRLEVVGGRRAIKWVLSAVALAAGVWALHGVPDYLHRLGAPWDEVHDLDLQITLSWTASLWRFLFPALLASAALLLPAIAAIRAILRNRFYRFGVEPIARLVERTERWRGAGRVGAFVVPSVAYFLLMRSADWYPISIAAGHETYSPFGFWIAAGLAFAVCGSTLLVACWSLLTAELVDGARRGQRAVDASGMSFRAAALTREAFAGTAVLLAFAAGGAIVASAADMAQLQFDGTTLLISLGLYCGAATAVIAQFLRASRITVGLDGILIHGTSRRRFFGYHELDTAEATHRAEILLRRGGRVVLCLQPHGEDAQRREALALRIQQQIDVAKALATGAAMRLAETPTPDGLRSAARGGDGYRDPGAGRDELWQLVEAPVASSAHRCAAAEALLSDLTGDERRRMRVAAEHCADPAARAILLRIATASEAGEEEEDQEQLITAPTTRMARHPRDSAGAPRGEPPQ